ncbi:unnamed protein product [Symbiodinium natans]|uniref:Uncharacterized protein n=1 Tax=Symbiodinium natans TaxID=878477 RepID=A0A812TFT3_9DINO|nr:unnamed protein product [Symbiodinium natans]
MELGSDDGVVAVSFNENSTGKTFADTKVRYTWELAIDGKMHTIEFTNTKTSGKKRVFVDGRLLHEMTVLRSRNFQYSWPIGGHLLSIVPVQSEGSDSMLDKVMDRVASSVDCPFELRINGLPFRSFRKRSVVPVRPTRPLPVSQGYVSAPAAVSRPVRPSPEQLQADREYEEMRRRVEDVKRQKESHRPQLTHQESFDRRDPPRQRAELEPRKERAQSFGGGDPWSQGGALSSKSPRRTRPFDVEGEDVGFTTGAGGKYSNLVDSAGSSETSDSPANKAQALALPDKWPSADWPSAPPSQPSLTWPEAGAAGGSSWPPAPSADPWGSPTQAPPPARKQRQPVPSYAIPWEPMPSPPAEAMARKAPSPAALMDAQPPGHRSRSTSDEMPRAGAQELLEQQAILASIQSTSPSSAGASGNILQPIPRNKSSLPQRNAKSAAHRKALLQSLGLRPGALLNKPAPQASQAWPTQKAEVSPQLSPATPSQPMQWPGIAEAASAAGTGAAGLLPVAAQSTLSPWPGTPSDVQDSGRSPAAASPGQATLRETPTHSWPPTQAASRAPGMPSWPQSPSEVSPLQSAEPTRWPEDARPSVANGLPTASPPEQAATPARSGSLSGQWESPAEDAASPPEPSRSLSAQWPGSPAQVASAPAPEGSSLSQQWPKSPTEAVAAAEQTWPAPAQIFGRYCAWDTQLEQLACQKQEAVMPGRTRTVHWSRVPPSSRMLLRLSPPAVFLRNGLDHLPRQKGSGFCTCARGQQPVPAVAKVSYRGVNSLRTKSEESGKLLGLEKKPRSDSAIPIFGRYCAWDTQLEQLACQKQEAVMPERTRTVHWSRVPPSSRMLLRLSPPAVFLRNGLDHLPRQKGSGFCTCARGQQPVPAVAKVSYRGAWKSIEKKSFRYKPRSDSAIPVASQKQEAAVRERSGSLSGPWESPAEAEGGNAALTVSLAGAMLLRLSPAAAFLRNGLDHPVASAPAPESSSLSEQWPKSPTEAVAAAEQTSHWPAPAQASQQPAPTTPAPLQWPEMPSEAAVRERSGSLSGPWESPAEVSSPSKKQDAASPEPSRSLSAQWPGSPGQVASAPAPESSSLSEQWPKSPTEAVAAAEQTSHWPASQQPAPTTPAPLQWPEMPSEEAAVRERSGSLSGPWESPAEVSSPSKKQDAASPEPSRSLSAQWPGSPGQVASAPAPESSSLSEQWPKSPTEAVAAAEQTSHWPAPAQASQQPAPTTAAPLQEAAVRERSGSLSGPWESPGEVSSPSKKQDVASPEPSRSLSAQWPGSPGQVASAPAPESSSPSEQWPKSPTEAVAAAEQTWPAPAQASQQPAPTTPAPLQWPEIPAEETSVSAEATAAVASPASQPAAEEPAMPTNAAAPSLQNAQAPQWPAADSKATPAGQAFEWPAPAESPAEASSVPWPAPAGATQAPREAPASLASAAKAPNSPQIEAAAVSLPLGSVGHHAAPAQEAEELPSWWPKGS